MIHLETVPDTFSALGADVTGPERTGRGVRVAERAVGLDDAVGSGDVRDAGGARGIRAEDPAGASEGGHLTSAPTGATSRSSPDRGASGGGGSSPGIARDESVRDRAATGDRPDVGAEDLGAEELRGRSMAARGKPREADGLHLPRSGLVVCRACSTAWGCESPAQPDGGEVLAKRKGVAARRGLKAAWSKTAT